METNKEENNRVMNEYFEEQLNSGEIDEVPCDFML